MSSRRVIIVGGGFGGVTLAQHLERKISPEVEIVLKRRSLIPHSSALTGRTAT